MCSINNSSCGYSYCQKAKITYCFSRKTNKRFEFVFFSLSPVNSLYTQFSSATQTCPSLCNPMDCMRHARPPCPSPTPGVYSNSCPLSWWCHRTISSSVVPFSSHLQSFPHQSLFKWISSSHQVAIVLEFQLQDQSFQWIFRTDSFRMDWLDLLADQGTLKSLLQHHSSKASVLWHSAFFIVQLSHPYMTAGKTIALTRWTFVGKHVFTLHVIKWKFPKLLFWLTESEPLEEWLGVVRVRPRPLPLI